MCIVISSRQDFFFGAAAILAAGRAICPYLNSDCGSSQQVCFAVVRLHMCGPRGSCVCSTHDPDDPVDWFVNKRTIYSLVA